MNAPTTDTNEVSNTPRTDANAVSHIGFYSCATVPADFARKLERELAASQAEVERLKSDKANLITQCANLLESLVPSHKSPSTEWHRKQAENNKAYLK